MLVILDTNVLLSSFLWPGKTSKLIPLMESGLITPCFSRETLGELRKVLLRPKFKTRLAKMSLEVKTILETLKQNSKIFNLPKIEEILESDLWARKTAGQLVKISGRGFGRR